MPWGKGETPMNNRPSKNSLPLGSVPTPKAPLSPCSAGSVCLHTQASCCLPLILLCDYCISSLVAMEKASTFSSYVDYLRASFWWGHSHYFSSHCCKKRKKKKRQAQHSRLGISAKKPVGSFWNHAESTSVPPLCIYCHEDPWKMGKGRKELNMGHCFTPCGKDRHHRNAHLNSRLFFFLNLFCESGEVLGGLFWLKKKKRKRKLIGNRWNGNPRALSSDQPRGSLFPPSLPCSWPHQMTHHPWHAALP